MAYDNVANYVNWRDTIRAKQAEEEASHKAAIAEQAKNPLVNTLLGAAASYLTGGLASGLLGAIPGGTAALDIASKAKGASDIVNAAKTGRVGDAVIGGINMMPSGTAPIGPQNTPYGPAVSGESIARAMTPAATSAPSGIDWGGFLGGIGKTAQDVAGNVTGKVGEALQPNRANLLSSLRTGLNIAGQPSLDANQALKYGIMQGIESPLSLAEAQQKRATQQALTNSQIAEMKKLGIDPSNVTINSDGTYSVKGEVNKYKNAVDLINENPNLQSVGGVSVKKPNTGKPSTKEEPLTPEEIRLKNSVSGLPLEVAKKIVFGSPFFSDASKEKILKGVGAVKVVRSSSKTQKH